MISYEGLLQKLNKGNNFPASLPGWNKSGRNFRFSESCGIIKTKKKTIFPSLCLAAEKMRKKCGKNRPFLQTKNPVFENL